VPLLRGEELERVVALLERRGVLFYHACQLKDFRSYLQVGGIPSRQLMESSNLPFTEFDTDDADHDTGSWAKVFGNLSDFGRGFAFGADTKAVPNPYGPILLVSRPGALRRCRDMAICLRSAGVQGYDRAAESLGTRTEVNRLFKSAYDAGARYGNADIKFSEELRSEFSERVQPRNVPGWRTLNPEVSCTIQNELISFNDLAYIVVDSYTKEGVRLLDIVESLTQQHAVAVRALARRYRDGANRERILRDVVRQSDSQTLTLERFSDASGLAQETRAWIDRLLVSKLGWQFDRYAKYIRRGTLRRMA
jgi:hypothetical protein